MGVAGTIVAMQVIFAVIRTIDSELLSMLTLHWAAWPFALALSVSLICVLLAAASPARKCAKVSPMGAVRGEASLRQDIKKARGGWFTKRAFGFAGLMSARNMRRNPRKYRATLLSVTCSIALFMLINGFTSGMRASLSMYASASNMDVTVAAEQDADSDGQVLKKLKAIDSAKDIARMLTIPVRLNVADSAFTDEVVQLYDDVSSAKYANLRFIGESEFRQLTFDGRAPSYEEFCQPGAAVVMQKLVLAGSRGLQAHETMHLQPGDRAAGRAKLRKRRGNRRFIQCGGHAKGPALVLLKHGQHSDIRVRPEHPCGRRRVLHICAQGARRNCARRLPSCRTPAACPNGR